MVLLTVGHGRLNRDELGGNMQTAGVEAVIDVRSYPGSRANSDAARAELTSWLPERGISYRWDNRLGGRRHLGKEEDAASLDTWWRVAAFRAYAAHTRSAEFHEAMTDLVQQARSEQVAIMCSESVWWRCHRRIIADVAVLAYGLEVSHLMPDGRLRSHLTSPGARLAGTAELVWDVAEPT